MILYSFLHPGFTGCAVLAGRILECFGITSIPQFSFLTSYSFDSPCLASALEVSGPVMGASFASTVYHS